MSAVTDNKPKARWGAVLAPVLIDLVVPLLIFYGLRRAGVGVVGATLAGSVIPVVRTAYSLVRGAKVDWLAIFMISALALGTIASLAMDSPRMLLAKDGVITALCGFWMLGTLLAGKPLLLSIGRGIAEAKRGKGGGEIWASRWDTEPRFRHGLRLITAVWGIGLVLDAVVRVVIAYTLPLDAVPGVTTTQWIALFVVLYGFMIVYSRKNDLLA
ncbi:VC0807 family protein [Kribbella monticola]|uniref:VC0807 family protein n=1 Tax=Kribbella monticola TaxID=2185285 RepID=UPI000DD35119|nr:VC0807 family protein [Kribbella monticola]